MLAASVLWLLVILVWRPVIDAPFVHDDVVQIVDREQQIDAPWRSWSSLAAGQRPLVQVTLGLNYLIGGLDPRGYHALNIALHGVAAALCFVVLRVAATTLVERQQVPPRSRLLFWSCLAMAGMWAIHPIQTASVSYVIQRAELLVGIGALLAVWGLLRASSATSPAWWRALAVLGCAVAILSKPSAATVPALVLAIDASICTGSFAVSLKRRWGMHAACWATLLALIPLGVVTSLIQTDGAARSAGLGVPGVSVLRYLWAEVGAFGVYASELIVPSLMSIDHGWTVIDGDHWPRIVGCAALLAMAGTVVVGLARGCWWWILGALPMLMLLPTSSFVPLRDPVADHRLYVALLSPVVSVVALAACAAEGNSLVRRVGSVASVGAVIVLAGMATIERNAAWCTPSQLWDPVIAMRPIDAKALMNRSLCRLMTGDDEGARTDAAAAFEIRPAEGPAAAMLGVLEVRAGNPDEALPWLLRAEELGTRTASVRGAKGDALRALGRPAEAAEAYAKARRRSPSSYRLKMLHGMALAESGSLDEARALLTEVATDARDADVAFRAREYLDALAKADRSDSNALQQPASSGPSIEKGEPR
jgi:hypothetical protein